LDRQEQDYPFNFSMNSVDKTKSMEW
jgi:hypothetical protein